MPRTPYLARFLGTILILCLTGAARADEYYVAVFGAQSDPKRPKFSHSWATFIRTGCNDFEMFTISWMPCTLEIHPNRLFAEPGTKLDLHTSFEVVLANCENVMAWGPYKIECELFQLAKKHAERLESGDVRYKTLDFKHTPLRVSNCIHALTVFNYEKRRLRIGRTNFGHVASYAIAKSYDDWILCPEQVNCEIIPLLGISQYPVEWRTIEHGRPRD